MPELHPLRLETRSKLVTVHQSKVLHHQPGSRRASGNVVPSICCPNRPINRFIWMYNQRIKREQFATKWSTTDDKNAIKVAKARAKKQR